MEESLLDNVQIVAAKDLLVGDFPLQQALANFINQNA